MHTVCYYLIQTSIVREEGLQSFKYFHFLINHKSIENFGTLTRSSNRIKLLSTAPLRTNDTCKNELHLVLKVKPTKQIELEN